MKGRIKSTIEEWISAWYLEEVKENKDSILEKLREELEKRKQKMLEENWWPSYIEQVVWTLAVLDSLEQPKEEPHYQEHLPKWLSGVEMIEYLKDTYAPKEEQWSPTPWQMIEVSNDGEKWEKRIFDFFPSEENTWVWCRPFNWDEKGFLRKWKYARQPQEDIELLPEFVVNFDSLQENFTAKMATQIELLTSTVNQLIKANNK